MDKPLKIIVPREAARLWSPEKYLIQTKADGVFQTRQIDAGGTKATIAGEFITAKSGGFLTPRHAEMLKRNPGGCFIAWDVLAAGDCDMSQKPARARWGTLCGLLRWLPDGWGLIEHNLTPDQAFALGAEGVVAKGWNDPYTAPMLCCKQLTTYRCRVVSTGATQSVGIADAETGADRGHVALRGGKCDRVRVGSAIRVEGMGLTAAGKIREPRCTEEVWLVKF
jgi:hypothetical protein